MLRSNRGVIPAVAVVLLVLIGSCTGGAANVDEVTTSRPSPAGAEDLTAQQWALVSYTTVSGVGPPDVQGRNATLRFDADGSLSGTTGCNSFSGTYTADGSNLRITLGPLTRRACTDPSLNAQEQTLLEGLGQITAYRFVESTLSLSTRLKRVFAYQAESLALEGTWAVTGLNDGNSGVVGSAATNALTMSFNSAGEMSVTGGCNTLRASYALGDQGALEIGPVASTERACDGDAADAERWMIDALGRSAAAEVAGDSLTLRDQAGAMQVAARRSGS